MYSLSVVDGRVHDGAALVYPCKDVMLMMLCLAVAFPTGDAEGVAGHVLSRCCRRFQVAGRVAMREPTPFAVGCCCLPPLLVLLLLQVWVWVWVRMAVGAGRPKSSLLRS